MKNILGFMKLLRDKQHAGQPDSFLRKTRFVVIDTELTGLNEKRDSIISLGAVRMDGGRIILSDPFYRLVNPNTHFEPESVVIHGITPSEVIEQPDIDIVMSEFLEFCGNDVIVGYCVDIDLHFINKAMMKLYNLCLSNAVIDIYRIYEWLRKRVIVDRESDQKPLFLAEGKLYELAKAYGIAVNGAHNAMVDAFITAQVFQRFLPMLINRGIETVGELIEIGHPKKGGDAFSKALEKSSY